MNRLYHKKQTKETELSVALIVKGDDVAVRLIFPLHFCLKKGCAFYQ